MLTEGDEDTAQQSVEFCICRAIRAANESRSRHDSLPAWHRITVVVAAIDSDLSQSEAQGAMRHLALRETIHTLLWEWSDNGICHSSLHQSAYPQSRGTMLLTNGVTVYVQ